MDGENRRFSWPVLGNNGLKALRPKHQGVQTGKNDEDTGGPSSTSSGSTSTPKQRIQKGIQTSPSDADLNLQISDEESEEDNGKPEYGKKLFDEERRLLRNTFDHLNKRTLLVTDIEKALVKPEFTKIFETIKRRRNLDDRGTKKLLQSSYRAMHRDG